MADWWATGPFPATRTLIVSPAANLALGKTVTLSAGAVDAAFPLANATDGEGATVARLASPYPFGSFVVDLGAAATPDIVAIINHNIDAGVLVTVEGDTDSGFPTPEVSVEFTVSDPVGWIDLRSLNFVPCRYWRVGIPMASPNSVPLSIGEIVIGAATAFEGVIDESHEQMIRSYREQAVTEHGLVQILSSGASQRGVRVSVTMFTDDYDYLLDALEDAGLNGGRILFIPDSRIQTAFWVEGLTVVVATRRDEHVVTAAMDLVEESFGVSLRGQV